MFVIMNTGRKVMTKFCHCVGEESALLAENHDPETRCNFNGKFAFLS